MTTLKDRNLPTGAIIEEFEDGGALRNDGVRLMPANKNPWYVLATIAGEQEVAEKASEFDEKLAAKNRRYWNGWVCQNLSDEKRAVLAEKLGENLDKLTSVELKALKAKFKKTFDNDELPSPNEWIIFAGTYFIKPVNLDKYAFLNSTVIGNAHFVNDVCFSQSYFDSDVSFSESHFDKTAHFNGSNFSDSSYFTNSYFNKTADFSDANFVGIGFFNNIHFSSEAEFSKTHFASDAYFKNAHFGNAVHFCYAYFASFAHFNDAHFAYYTFFNDVHFADETIFIGANFVGKVTFNSAQFIAKADFSSAEFKSKTGFNDVKFWRYVPEFHVAKLYDDTIFPTLNKMEDQWPPTVGKVDVPDKDEPVSVMPAKEQKRAYNRLRLFMNKSQQIDEEMFFHRREMACKTEIETGLVKWLFKIYGTTSGYGSYVGTPLLGLLAIWFIGMMAMLAQLTQPGIAGHLAAFPAAAGWSFSNLFPFFGFRRLYFNSDFIASLPPHLDGIGAIQTVFGFIFLFLLGLGLRNRFRLR